MVRVSLLALLGILASSCETPRPTEMTVAGHQQAAAAERERAAEEISKYDENAAVANVERGTNGEPRYRAYNPTERYLRAAAQHTQLAKAHEEAAAALDAFEDSSCRPFSAAVRASCPLLGNLKSIERLPDGARVELMNAAETDAVAAHMQCHIAFGDAHGDQAVAGCPLYIRGLSVSARDGHITFRVRDPSDTPKLMSMLAEHLAPASAPASN